MKDLKEQIEKQVAEALRECLKDIPNEVKRGARNTVARALGFSDSWAKKGWEVDHCNGRGSHVSSLVTEAAKEKVVAVVKRASDTFKLNTSQEKAIIKDMESVFMRELRTELRKKIEKLAAEQAEELAKKIIPNLKELAFDMGKSLADPEFGSKELEKLAMEIHVENAEGKK